MSPNPMLLWLLLAADGVGPPPPPPPPLPPGTALSVCKALSEAAARRATYVRGNYRVVGLRGTHAYTGAVSLTGPEDARVVAVAGTLDGVRVQGTARGVECGPDRVPQMEVTWTTDSGLSRTAYCALHTDYDNFHRMSCSPKLSDPNGDIELWVERYEG